MRDFIEGIRSTDDLMGYISENRGQAVKLAVLLVSAMAVLLFMLHGNREEDLLETADPEGNGAVYSQEGVSGEQKSYGFDGKSGTGAGGSENGSSAVSRDEEVYVDIGGAVKSPKVARLAGGSRIEDAINEAGGLSADADISSINRAQILSDGEKIYIPKKGEDLQGDPFSSGNTDAAGTGGIGTGGTEGNSPGGKININTADLSQLQTLTGVGPVTAQKILDYRSQNGRFNSVEDLKNVSGIGDKTFEKMKDQVTV